MKRSYSGRPDPVKLLAQLRDVVMGWQDQLATARAILVHRSFQGIADERDKDLIRFADGMLDVVENEHFRPFFERAEARLAGHIGPEGSEAETA